MLHFTKRFLRGPQPGCEWADKMILNPAMIRDPENPNRIHMLFRATGPWSAMRRPGQPLPYPIFVGYAVSDDAGANWQFDFSRPALAPTLEQDRDRLYRRNDRGEQVFNYANGCIEDPRLFYFEEELYLSVACRVFPPGPYWEKDDPVQCMPQWARTADCGLGAAVTGNTTVSLLFKVDLKKLAGREYDQAFTYVAPLHEPDVCDNRDVFLFPRRLMINGSPKIVALHRPQKPQAYAVGKGVKAASIFLAAADTIDELSDGSAIQHVLAEPLFPWEADRIGASWAPMEIEPGLWLLPYHGKQDTVIGYTQSFLLLQESADGGFPQVVARPAERMLYADQPWELDGEFATPCLFTCSGVLTDDGKLLMGYGSADTKLGLVSVDYHALIDHMKSCRGHQPAAE